MGSQKAEVRSQEIDCTINNEKGIALMMVLVLSLIALAIISALLYLVIQGTKFSGFHKRYASALDAGIGGAEISAALVTNRGELVIQGLVNLPTSCICGFDTNPFDEIYPDPLPNNCLCRKLCMPPYNIDGSYNWTICGSDGTSLDPVLSPDIPPFDLSGYGTNYRVFAKIVDTTVGVTDLSGENLSCGAGAAYECATFTGPPTPYLYRIEINSQDTNNPVEKARLSVLYAY
ncbi:MAG: hypothetical protein HXY53_00620 [Nitrospirae bacterium]|nr:hypothetical protein [Nitrospirota bacterium]